MDKIKVTIKYEAPWYTDEKTFQEDLNDIMNYIQKKMDAKDMGVDIENL